MQSLAATERNHALALFAIDDINMASRSTARLLITASTQQVVEGLARRIHANGPRAAFPLLPRWAGDLPADSECLKKYCAELLDSAAGGTVLLNAVEEMPPVVQHALIDLVGRLEISRSPSAAVRLISGTTVSLLDRVAAGTFSERLFYRLNIIHLTVGSGPEAART